MAVFRWLFCLKGSVQRVQLKCFSPSLAGVLGAIWDRVCGAQDKTESGIFLSDSFSIMLIFNNHSSMILHRLIFSWKDYCFKIFFRSREQSSSANKKGAVVLQRRQGSSPSHKKKPQTAAVKGCVPTITNSFCSQMCEVCSLCCERCPSFCESIA